MATRYAANRIVSEKQTIINGVVVVSEEGTIIDIEQLTQEVPYTIWLGGTIELQPTDKGLQAFKEGKLLE